MVQAVVQRDEREAARAQGEIEVADVRLRHDLAREQLCRPLEKLCGVGHLFPSKCGFSQITVPPMPKPMHMVVMP